MIVIGIGNTVHQDELEGMASNINGKKQVYKVTSYDSLNSIQADIVHAACDVQVGKLE